MKKKIAQFVVLCMLFTSIISLNASMPKADSAQATYYVSPSGSDSNPGTIELPFQTIDKARRVVETCNSQMTGDIIIYLRDGTYTQGSTLSFGTADSGTNGFNVIYKAYPGETPIISGGQQITGWSLYDSTKNIYRAYAGDLSFRQLYVNDTRMTRARYPDAGSYSRKENWKTGSKNIYVDTTAIANCDNLTSIELCTLNNFTSNHMRIATVNDGYVTIQSPEADILFNASEAFRGRSYWYENAYEFISVGGEWYLNPSDHYVYCMPRDGDDMSTAQVIAPNLEKIVDITGTSLSEPVTNIQFYGIKFMYSTWLYPDSNGCIEHQAFHIFSNNQNGDDENTFGVSGGVNVRTADYIRFERCSFSHMGANGLKLYDGTHYCTIIGNVISDISGNGIYEMKQNNDNAAWFTPYNPSDAREVCSNDTIENNYIHDIGMDYMGSIGIFCGFTKNVSILHNEICNTPYTGVSVGWGWTSDPNVMTNNTIDYNYLHDNTQSRLWDGGSIYTLSEQPNSSVSYNYMVGSKIALFHDIGTGHYTDVGNVINSPGCTWYYLWTDSIHNISFQNNYTNSNKHVNYGTNITETGTTVVSGQDWPEDALNIINNAGIETNYKDILNSSPTPTPAVALTPTPTVALTPIPTVALTPTVATTVTATPTLTTAVSTTVTATPTLTPAVSTTVTAAPTAATPQTGQIPDASIPFYLITLIAAALSIGVIVLWKNIKQQ